MYLDFASRCFIQIHNYANSWELYLKESNLKYHITEHPKNIDLHVKFESDFPYSTDKVLHPKYGATGDKIIIRDNKEKAIAFDMSKIGVEETDIIVEQGFNLKSLHEILLEAIKIVLLNKGIACLHASSYLTENGAKIISGWEGIGKSAIMLKKVYAGDRFLSDDRTFLSKDGQVYPIYSDIIQYSGEFSSFKELSEYVGMKERFVMKTNIFLHSLIRKNKSSLIHRGLNKTLHLLRKLNLYEIHIPLEKVSIGENTGHELKQIFVLQQVNETGISDNHVSKEDLISSIINTTKFDDQGIFRLYDSYKYLFPDKTNVILEEYDHKLYEIITQGINNAKISHFNILRDSTVSETIKIINA